LFYGDKGYGKPAYAFSEIEGLTMLLASGTSDSHTLRVILPRLSFANSRLGKSKLHLDIPPSTYSWRPGFGETYWLYKGEERTGMLVSRIRLWIGPKPTKIIKPFKLKHKVFGIIFFFPETDGIHLVDLPTLREAKELAESYYKQWLQVKEEALDDAS
jgi:hypothetical protein